MLIDLVVKKFDDIFNNRQKLAINDENFLKLERIYEKLIHIK